jgi:Tfp pilus assembly protein PilO
MSRFLLPIILIGASLAIFMVFINPLYQGISDLRAQVSSYDEALTNSKALENERDKLTQKFNSITASDLERIKKMLPENVDNIRLILEIEKIASPFGMALRDVRYNPTEDDTPAPSGGIQASPTATAKEYGVWDLEFSTTGSYTNFLNFIKALESNLRIVDIASVEFSSETAGAAGAAPSVSSPYKYNFKIKTYWLKN